MEEGHFSIGLREGYWKRFDASGNSIEEGTYKKGLKEGFWLKIKNNKPYLAEKYEQGELIGSWTSLAAFKRDNKISDD